MEETNAATSFDYTLYETSISIDYLELILKLEADRMANLSFSEEEITAEKMLFMKNGECV